MDTPEQQRRVRMAQFQVAVAQAAMEHDLTVGEVMATLAGMLAWDAERYVLAQESAHDEEQCGRCTLVRLDWASPPHGPRCVLPVGHESDCVWEYQERRK